MRWVLLLSLLAAPLSAQRLSDLDKTATISFIVVNEIDTFQTLIQLHRGDTETNNILGRHPQVWQFLIYDAAINTAFVMFQRHVVPPKLRLPTAIAAIALEAVVISQNARHR